MTSISGVIFLIAIPLFLFFSIKALAHLEQEKRSAAIRSLPFSVFSANHFKDEGRPFAKRAAIFLIAIFLGAVLDIAAR